jgi:4-amino-4-deoxy-L-arabinose transferase and related glycosyltransferases of PMT family
MRIEIFAESRMKTRQLFYRRFSCRAVALYLITLVTVLLLFPNYRLEPLWLVWGLCEVFGFFGLSYLFYDKWKDDNPRLFCRKLFLFALSFRVVYVVGLCYYFYFETGLPFEYEAGDSLRYHRQGVILSKLILNGDFETIFKYLASDSVGFSDKGYPLYLSIVYSVFGRNILTPRLLKSLMGAAVCVIIYKLASRTFDNKTGKLAAVLCLVSPTLIHYAGLHTKETEMLFLAVLALERLDYLVRSKKFSFFNIVVPIVLIAMVFGFRTILGMVLLFSFVLCVIFDPEILSKKTKAVFLPATLVLFFTFLFSGIGYEMKTIFRLNFFSHDYMVEKYEEKGLEFSEFAQSKYLASGVLFLPLSSLVSVANGNQKLMNGSMFVNSLMAFFALWAVVTAIREKNLRRYVLVGAYAFSYLFIIAFSFSVMSERYHLPVLPVLLIMAAYAMRNFRKSDLKYYNIFLCLLFVALLAWNYIKLAGRGLI